MKRTNQVVLIASFIPFCWLAFMAVHELGHVIAGWATGGTVTKVVLHPLTFSRTDVNPSPEPLIVVWAGPIVGIGLPLLIWGLFFKLKIPGRFLTRFFAGFCLIANGTYLGIGSLDNVGDAGELLSYGSPAWMLWIFGIITVPLGLLLWHGMGPKFGLGESKGHVDEWAAYVSLGLFVVLFLVTFLISPRF